jgi:hypothetical protein
MTRFITLSGRKQAGKDTSAIFIRELLASDRFEHYVDDNGEIQITNSIGNGPLGPFGHTMVHIVHFADALKKACHIVFGIPLEDMETEKGKQKITHILWPQKTDGGWVACDGMPEAIDYQPRNAGLPMTVREVLQFVGTELFRHQIYADVWIQSVFRRPREDRDIVIIADARFPNEARFALKYGMLIKVERDTNLEGDGHDSETALDNYNDYHHIIKNNGSFDDLCKKLHTVLQIHGLVK